MSTEKIKPNAGAGGKLGRSNMHYWGTNDEAKVAARKRRRHADRESIDEGLSDAEERIPSRSYTRKRTASKSSK